MGAGPTPMALWLPLNDCSPAAEMAAGMADARKKPAHEAGSFVNQPGISTMDNKQVIDTLNDLIENCKDGEFGFHASAEHARTEGLKQVFLARSQDCRKAAEELRGVVGQLGGKSTPDGGTLAGAAHRGWVAVKGTLAGYSDLNMLEEAERGEDKALERYREALEHDLPADVRVVVQRQYEGAKRNHGEIRTLRDQARLRDKA